MTSESSPSPAVSSAAPGHRAGATQPVGTELARQSDAPVRAEAVVDLDAISANTAALREHVDGRQVMAVVKADGYGHGIVPAGRAARAGGADWLGVALLAEALALRAAGDAGPVLCWLATPGERYDAAVAADVEVSAYSVEQLAEIAAGAALAARPAKVQLKLDSGLGRGGAHREDWPRLVHEARVLRDRRAIDVTGVWSHLACSDEPGHPSIARQTDEFEAGVRHALDAGLEPAHLHLANSGGVLASPGTWFSLVRPGIALYGVSPFADGSSPVPLLPAMTLQARIVLVKRAHAGQGVSYGLTYVTDRETRLALVPLGYGDGVPRHASSRGPVLVNGRRLSVSGRVCMDQFVVDLADVDASAGDVVVLFGDPERGEPSAHDWAQAADTIGYEIVTRVGSRVPRRYVGEAAG